MRTLALALAAAAAFAGCKDSPPPASPQPPAANTGFFAIASAGTQHKLYVPTVGSSTNAQLAVVDAATPNGRNGVLKYLDLGGFGMATAVGASGTDVVAVDLSSTQVYFVDAANDTVKGIATLPADALRRPVSDHEAYSHGVAVDATRRRAWASVSYGFVEYDLDTRAEVASHRVPASENFAYDPVARHLLAPYYPCEAVANPPELCVNSEHPGGAALTDGLTHVDLAAGGTAASFADDAAADPAAPLGREVDAVTVDFGLGLAAVSVELPSRLVFLDLSTSAFDAAAGRWTATSTLSIDMPGPAYTAASADAQTHLLTVCQEAEAGLLFVDLAKAKAGVEAVMPVTMPDLPDGSAWGAQRDPHGVITGVVAGRPYAFALHDSRYWVARIDLLGVRALMDGGAGSFASLVSYIGVPSPP